MELAVIASCIPAALVLNRVFVRPFLSVFGL